jgi:hypothetical protein
VAWKRRVYPFESGAGCYEELFIDGVLMWMLRLIFLTDRGLMASYKIISEGNSNSFIIITAV